MIFKELKRAPFFLFCLCVGACNSGSKQASGSAPKAAPTTATQVTNATSSSSSSMPDLNSLFGRASGSSGAGAATTQATTADPNAIVWATRFGAPFLAFPFYDLRGSYTNAATANSYSCPGDSFLVGFYALYSKSLGDRTMQPYCQFFEDAKGRPVKKSACDVYPSSTPAIEAGSDAPDFHCPAGKLIAGLQVGWDTSQSDRSYRFECCEAISEDAKKIDFTTNTDASTGQSGPVCEKLANANVTNTLTPSTLMGALDQHCAGGTVNMQTGSMDAMPSVIHTLSTNYIEHKTPDGIVQNDRQWYFECCAIGLKN